MVIGDVRILTETEVLTLRRLGEEGSTVIEACRILGVATDTFYRILERQAGVKLAWLQGKSHFETGPRRVLTRLMDEAEKDGDRISAAKHLDNKIRPDAQHMSQIQTLPTDEVRAILDYCQQIIAGRTSEDLSPRPEDSQGD